MKTPKANNVERQHIREKLIFSRTYNISYMDIEKLSFTEWNEGWELIANTHKENKGD